MRISDSTFSTLAQRGLQKARTRVALAQSHASTNKRVEKASDDAPAAARASQHSARLRRAQAYEAAAQTGYAELGTADAALEDVSNLVSRARELAVQASNGTFSAEQRAAIGLEVDSIQKQIIQLGNAQHEGHYVFAGFQDDQPAFDASGSYMGDNTLREVEVASGVRLSPRVSADRAFGVGGTGVNILATLDSLKTALQSNDLTTIRGSLDPLDSAVSQVASARAEAGVKMDAFDVSRAVAVRTQDSARVARAGEVEIDIFDATNELLDAERSLEVAVKIAGRANPPAGLLGSSGG